jgi:hypothetical protein
MTQDHSSERAQLSDERIAFEAWCQCLWNKDRLATEKGIFSDWYRDSEIDGMWGAWQARAAIAADRATAPVSVATAETTVGFPYRITLDAIKASIGESTLGATAISVDRFREVFNRGLPCDTVPIQEAWEAAGGNPGIKPTRDELISALQLLDEVCDEADAAPVSVAEPVASMADMRMLIQRLAHSLRRAAPDNALAYQAMDYLKRMAPVGSPLRDGDQS